MPPLTISNSEKLNLTIKPQTHSKKVCNNSSISFGMKLSSGQEGVIQDVLDRCVFSKKDLIFNSDNLSRLKIIPGNTYLTIENFFTKDSGDAIYGVCHELAIKTGKIIQEKLGHLHEAFIIKDKNFFNNVTHYFLGFTEKRNIVYDDAIFINKNTVDKSVLIDPSFKIYEPGSMNALFKNHSKDLIFGIPYAERILTSKIYLAPNNHLILGALKGLAPEKYNDSTKTLFFKFDSEKKNIRYMSIGKNDNSFTDITDELHQNLPENHPLINFYNHIQRQIN